MKQIGCDNKDIINLLYFADKLDNYLQLNGEKYLEKYLCKHDGEMFAKDNINLLIKKVETILDSNTHSDEMTLISKRQINSVETTLQNIISSQDPLNRGELEFFAHFINEALESISAITRPYENDEMLDVMFGEFCLGK